MMYMPSIFGESLFNGFDDFPMFGGFGNIEEKLYGKGASRMMKTDVRETEKEYELDIDLPGFDKDDIALELENGYLIINAAKTSNNEEKDKKGKLIRSERYSGSMQRSFYIGDAVTENEISAKFENGVLKLVVPKKEAKSVEQKKRIAITG